VPFAGEHEFVLMPDEGGAERRPVILFGGKNGSGKTSILRAVKLCVFRAAADADCPLAIDRATESCGRSRLGCDVCTMQRMQHE
jgi:hypothetical protein